MQFGFKFEWKAFNKLDRKRAIETLMKKLINMLTIFNEQLVPFSSDNNIVVSTHLPLYLKSLDDISILVKVGDM